MSQPEAAPAVTVQAVGSLQPHLPPAGRRLMAPTIGEALRQLHLPAGIEFVPMLNGRVAPWDTGLHEGDLIQLVPVIGGG